MKERKFLNDWKLAIMLSVLSWLFIFFEAGITLNIIKDLTFWTHNYFVFALIVTFVSSFFYMRKLIDFVWYEEGAAFGVVFVLIHVFLDYVILFVLMNSPIFNLQNILLYILQFLVCILASFVVKKKYIQSFRI